MSNPQKIPLIKGRTIGTVILAFAQFLIGGIHFFFGLWLITGTVGNHTFWEMSQIYNFYTLTFGFLVIVFTYGIWMRKRWGWIGTIGTLFFVTVVDSLTLLNLPSIPNIPKFAAGTEILYCLLVLFYSFKKHFGIRQVDSQRK